MEKIIYQKRRVGLGFNCVIELNQKMLILKRFVTKSSTDNFSVNNRHAVIKSSQTTQLYITKVFY
jgi:hypothetical protein